MEKKIYYKEVDVKLKCVEFQTLNSFILLKNSKLLFGKANIYIENTNLSSIQFTRALKSILFAEKFFLTYLDLSLMKTVNVFEVNNTDLLIKNSSDFY